MKSDVLKIVLERDKFENGREAWHACCPHLRPDCLGDGD